MKAAPDALSPLKGRTDPQDELRVLLDEIAGSGPIDIQTARLIIEPYAAAAAASNASDADLTAIRDVHAAAVAAAGMEAFETLDAEFHKLIFASTRNGLLACINDILKIVRGQPAWNDIKRRNYSEARRIGYCKDHQAIVEALLAHDATAAAAAMRAHVSAVSRNLFGDGGVL